jgi:hypothetical protein
MYNPTKPRGSAARNATRHPQLSSCKRSSTEVRTLAVVRPERQSHRDGGQVPAAVPPSPPVGGKLGQEGDRCGDLAARREALQQPQDDQHGRCRDADGGPRREQSDRTSGPGHQQHHRNQRGSPAAAIGPDSHQKRADRPGQERHREHREDRDQGTGLPPRREEHRREPAGERTEDGEVVPLHDVGDTRRGQGATAVCPSGGTSASGRPPGSSRPMQGQSPRPGMSGPAWAQR